MSKKISTISQKEKADEKVAKLMKEAELIKRQFNACQNFKEAKHILTEAKRAVDFYEGRQWGENKANLPFEKPTMNVIRTIIDSKVASINQKLFKINFLVDDDQVSTNNVTRFAEFQMKEMEQPDLNVMATYDGLIKGTYIYYFYWDKGNLRAITVDVEDIAVCNPNERDVQKQEYIILRTRESLKSIKDIAKDILADGDIDEFIVKNSINSKYTDNIEQENPEEPNVYSYLKFFKKDGEVYFEKATENIVYQLPTAMNPLTNEKIIRLEMQRKEQEENEVNEKSEIESDSVNRQNMNVEEDDPANNNVFKAQYFPFVIDSFIKRNNCIFGISMAYSMIPTQKLINQLLATNVLIAVKSAMPTLLVKQGALGVNEVNLSKPGGILVDRTVGQNGWGITALQTGTIPTTHFELAQNLIQMLKDVYKATDILDDGRNISKNMSGYAMSQLQTIQDKPIAQLQEILSRSIGREGRILEMYYKLYYHNKVYSYELSDTELLEQNPQEKDVTKLPRTKNDLFEGEDYINTPFNITIEVSETAKQSELMLVSTLETLFLNGTVSKLSPEDLMMWAELVPNFAFTKKDEFKRLIQKKMNSIIAQQAQQINDLQAQLQGVQMAYKSMQDEFNGRISQYNDSIREMKAGYSALERQTKRYERMSQNNQAKIANTGQ